MRTNHYSRQTRRAGLCIRTLQAPRHRVMLSHRGLVLTAYGHDLARLAVSIELSPEVTARILAAGPSAKPLSAAAC
jgi:hypothetical protein